MFVIDIKFKVDLETVNKYVMEHRQWLDTKYAAGLLLCSGPKEPRVGGIIIALGDEIDKIQELIQEDPYNQHGVAEYTITEFLPNKYNQHLKSLFE